MNAPWRLTPAEERGYCVTYRQGEVNRCPGCGRSQWLIGRVMAECGLCGTALPLVNTEGAVGQAE